LIKTFIGEREIILCIDETGDKKKGKLTDYVTSQYIGNLWKSDLNNLRLLIQPYIFYCLIQPWLTVFNIPGMKLCFLKLIDFMNDFRASPVSFSVVS